MREGGAAGVAPAAPAPARSAARAGDAGRSRGVAFAACLPGLAVALTAALAARLTWRSLGWPLFHDPPLMHFIAARILAGDAPYRDLFDMNLPGVYAAHALALRLLGPGDAAFRAFDLLVLGGTLAGLAVALRPFGPWAAASGPALVWLYHLAEGPWGAGQRDYLLGLPLAFMLAALLPLGRTASGPSPAVVWRAGLAGLALGSAVWIKPYAVLLVPLAAWHVGWVTGGGAPGRRRAALTALAIGLGLPGALVLGWLAARGALPAFLDVVTGYLVPLYSRLGRQRLIGGLLGLHRGPALLATIGGAVVAGLVGLGAARRTDGRLALLAGGAVYGLAHYAIQGKGWEYHLYPLAFFALALGAAGVGAVAAARRPVVAALLAVALLGGALVALLPKARETHGDSQPATRQARARDVAAALRPLVATGGTVQVLDTTAGGLHALFLIGARQPSRFLYDFHFYHDVGHPYVTRLRAELLAALRAAPPAAVVLFEEGWPAGGYERLAAFPELAGWLDGGYEVTRTGDGYRLYAPRRHR